MADQVEASFVWPRRAGAGIRFYSFERVPRRCGGFAFRLLIGRLVFVIAEIRVSWQPYLFAQSDARRVAAKVWLDSQKYALVLWLAGREWSFAHPNELGEPPTELFSTDRPASFASFNLLKKLAGHVFGADSRCVHLYSENESSRAIMAR